jgi:hypothetical protein
MLESSERLSLQRERIAYLLAAVQNTKCGARLAELADQLGTLAAVEDSSADTSIGRIIHQLLSIHARA